MKAPSYGASGTYSTIVIAILSAAAGATLASAALLLLFSRKSTGETSCLACGGPKLEGSAENVKWTVGGTDDLPGESMSLKKLREIEERTRHAHSHTPATATARAGASDNCRQGNFSIDQKGGVVVVGVAGGTGSGKSTLAASVLKALGEENVSYVCHDNYFKDLSHLPLSERAKNNFDHPDSLDTTLLIHHVQQLKEGKAVDIPTYCFKTHNRLAASQRVEPRQVILVEGILIYADAALRNEIDVKIFVDTEADVRFIRRLKRDIEERGREVGNIITQYLTTVKPMHDLFVEPSKAHSDVIVPWGINDVVLNMVVSSLKDSAKY